MYKKSFNFLMKFNICFLLILLSNAIYSAMLFNVTSNGLVLSITSNIPNKTYSNAGIKIVNSNEYTLANIGTECSLTSNGFCAFSVSNEMATNITLNGPTGNTATVTICLNAEARLACQNVSVTINQLLSFSGIRNDLTVNDVTEGGFSLCYSELYSNILDSQINDIKTPCTKDVLLVTCRPVGSTDLTVAAMALRTDVITEVAKTSTASHIANGSQWYFSQGWSFGFAPQGATISRSSCDISGMSENTRLCWHSNNTAGGYRCGNTAVLNYSNDWVKLVYQRDGTID